MTELRLEVAYGTPDWQVLQSVTVLAGATVQQAIEASGILTLCPEIDLTQNAVGIYSQQVTLTTEVQEGDRIEIYRPLQIDPGEARRLRAAKKSGRKQQKS